MFAYTDMSEATNTRVTAILRETYDGIILGNSTTPNLPALL